AEAMLGRGDRAFELFQAFLPSKKNDCAERYSMEPYAYAQFITGRDHPYKFGRARNSWLTGTATWAFVALSQYILGVRASYAGLLVDPAPPSDWKEFSVTRSFRGATYLIAVRGSGRVKSARLNGKDLKVTEGVPLCLPVLPA